MFGRVKCFTCPKTGHWKDFQAGHYIPQSMSAKLVFDEHNVQVQCGGCNKYRNGNPTVYAIELCRKYGPMILEELHSALEPGFKHKRADYERMIARYSEAVQSYKELDNGN